MFEYLILFLSHRRRRIPFCLQYVIHFLYISDIKTFDSEFIVKATIRGDERVGPGDALKRGRCRTQYSGTAYFDQAV